MLWRRLAEQKAQASAEERSSTAFEPVQDCQAPVTAPAVSHHLDLLSSTLLLLQGLHEVAWTGGLSRPLICPTDAANGLNSQALLDFHREHYVPGKVVLAGAPC